MARQDVQRLRRRLCRVVVVLVWTVILVHVVPAGAQVATNASHVLEASYSPWVGRVRSVSTLGIGNYDEQLAQIGRIQPTGPTFMVNPNDGIKRDPDKTIYGGTDKRIQVYEIPNIDAKGNAAAVASIVEKTEATIPGRGFCNAFLVTKDLALTASHCVKFTDYEVKRIRFNDQYVAEGLLGVLDTYEISDLVVWDFKHDFAVIRLKPGRDGKLPGDKYPPLRLENAKLAAGTPLYMIGHGGRDTKKMGTCSVITVVYVHSPSGKYTFGCDCTAFGGNSGSPVFNSRTHAVVGVFWGGQVDTRVIPKANAKDHEFVSPIWQISHDIPHFDVGTWPDEVKFLAGWFREHEAIAAQR